MTKEQVYDERINPLMAQVIAICREYNIAHVCSFSLSSEDEGGLACTSCNTTPATDPPEKYKTCVRLLYGGQQPTGILVVNEHDSDGNATKSTAIL